MNILCFSLQANASDTHIQTTNQNQNLRKVIKHLTGIATLQSIKPQVSNGYITDREYWQAYPQLEFGFLPVKKLINKYTLEILLTLLTLLLFYISSSYYNKLKVRQD